MTWITGRVWKFGDNISADDGIIQYSRVPDLGSFDIPALKAMCFATIAPDFSRHVCSGDMVVAGCNFGHHSHPHACVAMKESGVVVVLVESCDSAFIRKSLNVGLLVIPCPGVTAIVDDGAILKTNPATGAVRNPLSGATIAYRPLASQMIEVWQAGGLAPALRRRLGRGDASPRSAAG